MQASPRFRPPSPIPFRLAAREITANDDNDSDLPGDWCCLSVLSRVPPTEFPPPSSPPRFEFLRFISTAVRLRGIFHFEQKGILDTKTLTVYHGFKTWSYRIVLYAENSRRTDSRQARSNPADDGGCCHPRAKAKGADLNSQQCWVFSEGHRKFPRDKRQHSASGTRRTQKKRREEEGIA